MITKRPIRPDRLRQVPPSFSWLDHRLVRNNYLQGCDHSALALYLFLVTVGDAQGLSYYSDGSIGRYLNMTAQELAAARAQLQKADLIAYRKPLYQVLALEPDKVADSRSGKPQGQARSASEILGQIMPGGQS